MRACAENNLSFLTAGNWAAAPMYDVSEVIEFCGSSDLRLALALFHHACKTQEKLEMMKFRDVRVGHDTGHRRGSVCWDLKSHVLPKPPDL